jgi:hypothetical protein
MNNQINHSLLASFVLASGFLVAGALLAPGSAHAAGAKTSEAQLRYNQDRAKCMRGESNQDRATCLKEAGAALQESRKLGASGQDELAANRLKRCEGLPAADRNECVSRMGQGVTTGSAQQGGVMRELTSPVK